MAQQTAGEIAPDLGWAGAPADDWGDVIVSSMAVPTVEEAIALKGFDVRTWFGLAGPAGMPKDVVERLNAEMRKALAVPEVRQKLEAVGGEISPSTW